MLARDVMASPVITGRSDATVLEIVDLMLQHHISAVPIVDGDDLLIGIVSEGDLIQRDEIGTLPRRSWWLAALGGKGMLADDFVRSHGATAANVMTRKVVTASDDTPLWQIAEMLERKKVKRLPIVAGGKVIGIVSRANLLQALSAQRAAMADAPTGDDRGLRDRLMELLRNQPWTNASHLNVVVKHGTVYFWGRIGSVAEREALVVAAREISGVKDVVDNTHMTVTLI